MYKLIEYSDDYSQTFENLWQYCRDETALANKCDITDFNGGSADTNSFKIKEKTAGQPGNNGKKKVELMVSLKYLSNFWRTLEMPLINCETNFDLNWSEKCVIFTTNIAAEATTFSITDRKLYTPTVNVSTQDNAKLLGQLKSGFKRTIN